MAKWSTRSTRTPRSNRRRKNSAGGCFMKIVRFEHFPDFGVTPANYWVPPVDIYHTGERELVLKAELPDMSQEDIDITLENGTLTIKGEKKVARDVRDEQLRHVARRLRSFSR